MTCGKLGWESAFLSDHSIGALIITLDQLKRKRVLMYFFFSFFPWCTATVFENQWEVIIFLQHYGVVNLGGFHFHFQVVKF